MGSINFPKILALAGAAACFCLVSCFMIMAWTEPGNPPPQGIVVAPLNTGAVTQTKAGGLNVVGNVGIGTTGSDPHALFVTGSAKAGQFCLTDPASGVKQCCSNWNGCALFTKCTGGAVFGCLKCKADGSGWVDNCPAGKFCNSGACGVCPPGTVKNCLTCKADGSGWVDNCPAGKSCSNGTTCVSGCNECFYDGETSCNGTTRYTCGLDSNGCLKKTTATCTCVLGICF